VKVLLIDPEAARMAPLRHTLLSAGAEVTVAASGSFALTMLEWNRHDIVLSRADIGDMNGHELCAILKADPGTRDVRFVLVAGVDDVTTAETAAASVDLVLPPAMTGSAIVPLILRLVRADRATAEAAAGGRSAAAQERADQSEDAEPAAVPRIGPEAVAPPEAEPPKRYVTAATAAAAAPWSKDEVGAEPPAATAAPPPSLAPPAPRPLFPPPTRPAATPSPRPAPPGRQPKPAAAPVRSAPVSRPSTPAAPPPLVMPARAAAAPVTATDLMAIPSGTFQGSLEVLELADLTQALATGGKSGRLILALPQGGGLMLFDKGRVVHAEYRNAVGEEAFSALLAACQGEGAGRFCFLPAPAGQSQALPRTIDKSVDRLLLSSATAIDEKG
jgi:CheY-like chemotaxis protein